MESFDEDVSRLEEELLRAGRNVTMSRDLRNRTLASVAAGTIGLTTTATAKAGVLGWLSSKGTGAWIGGVVGALGVTGGAAVIAMSLPDAPDGPSLGALSAPAAQESGRAGTILSSPSSPGVAEDPAPGTLRGPATRAPREAPRPGSNENLRNSEPPRKAGSIAQAGAAEASATEARAIAARPAPTRPAPAGDTGDASGQARRPVEATRAVTVTKPAGPSETNPSSGRPDPHPETQPSRLREELSHLGQVESALATGNTGRALTLLGAYRESFPRPLMGLEAEILTIQALYESGSAASARRRAERFIASHPSSPLRVRAEQYMK